jgi:hypothetical protein
MKHNYQLLCCTVALSICASQLFAQNAILKPASSGLQAYHPIKKWRGLDIQSYLRGTGLFGGSYNTATGVMALQNANGNSMVNAADGYQALYNCTSCWGNTAVGASTLTLITTGYDNTAVGYAAETKNMLTANVSGYAAGTYNYSLIINGQLVGTRKMISIR